MAQNFFLYARKSTDTEDKQVLSIEAQLAELHSFAEKERLTIRQEFIEAMTAKRPGRPIFNEMISRIERGEAEGIIAWHPDRLARNSVDGGRVIYLLDTNHIKFLKFPTFWFENTPQGKFMMQIAFGQSKYYIDNLSENVKRGNRQKLRRGEWPGRAPLGYVNNKLTRIVDVDPVRGHLIRKLFEICATGEYPIDHLRAVATQIGLMSRDPRNRKNKLSLLCLSQMFRNPFYYGLMRHNGELHPGKHQPLISRELFDRVQEVLANRTKTHKLRKVPFPLLGLATCSACGCSITAERQKGHHYYRCSKKRGKCPERYVREEVLAEQIRTAISKVALPDPKFQQMMAEWAKDQANASQPVADLKEQISQKVPEIQEKLDRLLDAHLEGLIEKTEYQAKKATFLKRKIDLEERLKKMEQGATGWLEPMNDFLQAAHQAGQTAASENLEAQKNFLKKIGSNFRLAAKSLSFSYNLPWALLAAAARRDNMWALQGSNL